MVGGSLLSRTGRARLEGFGPTHSLRVEGPMSGARRRGTRSVAPLGEREVVGVERSVRCNPGRRLRVVSIGSGLARGIPVVPGVIRNLYDLLGSNMAPVTGMPESDWNTDEEFERWRRDVFCENAKKGVRHILLFEDQDLRGFLSYTVPSEAGEVYLNEFQIHPRFRGDGVTFRILLARFMRQVEQLPYSSIRTYTNSRNIAAQNLIEKMGFAREGRTGRGIRYVIARRGMETRFHRWQRRSCP